MPNYAKLWKLLIDRKLKKTQLRKACHIAPVTYSLLNKDQFVSLQVLARICDYLECDIGDIMTLEKAQDNE